MLRLQDGALEPPKMILTTRCSSWKVPGDLLPCWSSSSRLGEQFQRPRPRELLELPGLSRSSSLGRLGSSGATLLERARHSRAVWLASLCQGHLESRSLSSSSCASGTLLRPVGNSDGIVGAALAIVGLG